jgi:hypothetical protein
VGFGAQREHVRGREVDHEPEERAVLPPPARGLAGRTAVLGVGDSGEQILLDVQDPLVAHLAVR